LKIYRHSIDYQKLSKKISLNNVNEKTFYRDCFYSKNKINKSYVLREQKEFIENLNKKKNILFLISVDDVYLNLTSSLNPIYKNFVNLAFDAYLENDFEKAKNIFEDLLRLINNEINCDLPFSQNIQAWIEKINKIK
jgi:hypothetical protein